MSIGNFFDQDIKKNCQYKNIFLVYLGDSSKYFEVINNIYPVDNSGILFDELEMNQTIIMKEGESKIDLFIKKNLDVIYRTEYIVLLGDLFDGAYASKKDDIYRLIEILRDYPQNKYLFADDHSWCINCSKYNELEFGILKKEELDSN